MSRALDMMLIVERARVASQAAPPNPVTKHQPYIIAARYDRYLNREAEQIVRSALKKARE